MDFQHILKEKHLNNLINNHMNYLNHKDVMVKVLHQIKFSKSLKLIDPYYKLKNKRDLLRYKNNSILYRCLLKDHVKYFTYDQLLRMNLYQMKKSIDAQIFRKIEFGLWNNTNNFMILNFYHHRSISIGITRRCYFNLQHIDFCIYTKRQEFISKNY